jgi:head-tail adaptor
MRLDRRLVLEAVERVPDGAGGFAEVWASRGVLWGHVRPGAGREAEADFATLSTVPYRITVRAAPVGAPSRPVPGQRFREGTRMFRILAVTEEGGGGRLLVCFAREEVAS